MDEQEKFLERWSRRKHEAAKPVELPVATPAAEVEAAEPVDREAESPANPTTPQRADRAAAAGPNIDLSKLPSLDSITAATDVRPFLAPGVPPELARAALRRAWVADPAIRDFVGLQENDWDFTNPSSMAGFGELPRDFDLRKLVAEIFGETEPALEGATPTHPPQITQNQQPFVAELPIASDLRQQSDAADPIVPAGNAAEPVSEPSEVVQDSINTALQYNLTARRKHGSALPE